MNQHSKLSNSYKVGSDHVLMWLLSLYIKLGFKHLLTLVLSRDITRAGSGSPKTELPATMQFAPAAAASSIVEGPKPPSTCHPQIFIFIYI